MSQEIQKNFTRKRESKFTLNRLKNSLRNYLDKAPLNNGLFQSKFWESA